VLPIFTVSEYVEVGKSALEQIIRQVFMIFKMFLKKRIEQFKQENQKCGIGKELIV
jgi:hypothetical protein